MNITALSLVSLTFLTNSPAFVSNNWSIHGCNFNHFNNLLFYNQKGLFIKNSIFINGLGSIVKKEQENLDYTNKNYTNDNFKCPIESFVIINCRFENIKCGDNSDFIYFNADNGEYKILESSFHSCTSKQGIIFASKGSILTVNNSYSYKSYGKEVSAFIQRLGEVSSVYIYNNFITKSNCESKDLVNIYSDNGNHNICYNNITDCDIYGFKIIKASDLNILYNTVDIKTSCFYLGGNEKNVNLNTNYFYNSNCDEKPCIIISSNENYIMNIENSLLVSANYIIVGLSDYNEPKESKLILKNCQIQGNEAIKVKLEIRDGTNITFFDKCSTKTFSQSNFFTQSNYFSQSAKFSQTNNFSPSVKFTISSVFSNSYIFSQSNLFLSKPEAPEAGNQNNNNKNGNKGTIIGVVVGVVAAVSIAAAVTVVVIKKKRNVQYTSDIEMVNETNAVTVDNNLQDVMDDDDPFAEEFRS